MNNRKGFSLIELLIVMTIVGIVSTFVFASYSTVSERIAFQNQITSLQYWANDLRSRTFTAQNSSTGSSDTFVFLIDLVNKKIVTFKETDSNYFNAFPDQNIIDQYDFSSTNSLNLLNIKNFYYYDSSAPEPWLSLPENQGKLVIVYKSGDQNCLIIEESNLNLGEEKVTMIKFPIFNLESASTQPVKYAYIHKLSCNLEILNDEI